MLEICNHTRSALPQGIESRLDSTLGVVLESVLDSSLDCDLDSASKSTLDSTSLDSALGYFCRDGKNICEKIHIELVFVSTAKVRKINKEFLAKDYATDVLSFPLVDFPLTDSADSPLADFLLAKLQDLSSLDSSEFLPLLLGSIVINLPLARKNSLKFAHSLDDEIIILFIHAVLHLLGFDHERDRGAHRQKEREIMQKLNLSKNLKSLISRANSPQ
ncbi:rRNA maturation RNase YbeY [Helicobacter sp. MIT 01-3238]|uniref:rRNA maturation RNase YbeY n=1 Tax=Helicobacter sp. MIT 01-3238 TaxID=398627 RepID=UPI0026CB6227|nr:rRNA maturation RNase YbeY [Helicobacter sp. MIT 01-3238]